jgi:UDP:flavonoid glycosyltransferase YjiC (YdhE family)
LQALERSGPIDFGLPINCAALVADFVSTVLDDPAYRRNAERLRDEIAARPEPAYAVGLLERLAEEKRPLYSE